MTPEIQKLIDDNKWQPIEDAPNKTFVLLRGSSGYTTTPYRYLNAQKDIEYRPRQPWIDYANDSVLDRGNLPTHFRPLPDDRLAEALEVALGFMEHLQDNGTYDYVESSHLWDDLNEALQKIQQIAEEK